MLCFFKMKKNTHVKIKFCHNCLSFWGRLSKLSLNYSVSRILSKLLFEVTFPSWSSPSAVTHSLWEIKIILLTQFLIVENTRNKEVTVVTHSKHIVPSF